MKLWRCLSNCSMLQKFRRSDYSFIYSLYLWKFTWILKLAIVHLGSFRSLLRNKSHFLSETVNQSSSLLGVVDNWLAGQVANHNVRTTVGQIWKNQTRPLTIPWNGRTQNIGSHHHQQHNIIETNKHDNTNSKHPPNHNHPFSRRKQILWIQKLCLSWKRSPWKRCCLMYHEPTNPSGQN